MIPLRDSKSLLRFPFWTITIIIINLYVFYLEITSPNPDIFISQFALIASEVNPSNLNTLIPFITSQFLHAGFIHIIANMLFLWVFGNNVEATLGFILFPIFYLFSGIIAGLTQYFISPLESIPMLGASGAVAGVLGAYFALFPYHKIKSLLFIFFFVTIIEIPAYILLFYWFLTQLFSGVASISLNTGVGGIAFAAHIGGFLFGWIATVLIFPNRHYVRYKYT